jgi:hypothetical protein
VNLVDTRDVAKTARIALLEDRYVCAERANHPADPRAVSLPDIL